MFRQVPLPVREENFRVRFNHLLQFNHRSLLINGAGNNREIEAQANGNIYRAKYESKIANRKTGNIGNGGEKSSPFKNKKEKKIMKKLMFIAIAIMSVSFVGNTFGQAADWEIKPMVKKPKTTVKKRITKPTGIMQDYYAHSNIHSKSPTSQGDQPELQRKKTQRPDKGKSNFLPEKDDQVLLKRGTKRTTERKRN